MLLLLPGLLRASPSTPALLAGGLLGLIRRKSFLPSLPAACAGPLLFCNGTCNRSSCAERLALSGAELSALGRSLLLSLLAGTVFEPEKRPPGAGLAEVGSPLRRLMLCLPFFLELPAWRCAAPALILSSCFSDCRGGIAVIPGASAVASLSSAAAFAAAEACPGSSSLAAAGFASWILSAIIIFCLSNRRLEPNTHASCLEVPSPHPKMRTA